MAAVAQRLRRWATEDFGSAIGLSAENSPMIKQTVPALLGFLSICLPVLAQQPDLESITRDQLFESGRVDIAPALTVNRADLMTTAGGQVLINGSPALVLLDGRRLPDLPSLGPGLPGMSALELVPVAFLRAVQVQKTASDPMYGADGPGGVVNLELNRQFTGGGEAGFFYGASTGKHGGDDMQSYIMGGISDGSTSVFGGVSYESATLNLRRAGR
jgi:outer membrane receptor protein involved in Fe transport